MPRMGFESEKQTVDRLSYCSIPLSYLRNAESRSLKKVEPLF